MYEKQSVRDAFATTGDVGPPAEVNEMEVDEQRREAAPEDRRRATRPSQGSAMEIGGARFFQSLTRFMPGRQGAESSSSG